MKKLLLLAALLSPSAQAGDGFYAALAAAQLVNIWTSDEPLAPVYFEAPPPPPLPSAYRQSPYAQFLMQQNVTCTTTGPDYHRTTTCR